MHAYTHLVDFKDDEYTSKVAISTDEACKLIEAGFECICEINGTHMFRKKEVIEDKSGPGEI